MSLTASRLSASFCLPSHFLQALKEERRVVAGGAGDDADHVLLLGVRQRGGVAEVDHRHAVRDVVPDVLGRRDHDVAGVQVAVVEASLREETFADPNRREVRERVVLRERVLVGPGQLLGAVEHV